MDGAWRTISVALKADASDLVRGTATASAAVKKFGADSERTLRQHDQSVQKTGTRWRSIAGGIAGGIAIIGIALGLSLHEAIAWESAFAGVAKTVDGTTAQLADLEDGLLSMANRLPATRVEIAGVAEAAGALGIQRGAILAFTETMVGLGEATNLTADEAATMLAQFANIMGTSQTQFESLADTLVNLGNNGASTEKQILDLALRLAGAGATIGLTEKDVFALANAMASMGIDAELGGGALSRVMRKIETAVAGGGEKLLGFAKASGMSAAEFSKAWESDPAAALQTFLESMQDVQEAGGNMYGILADLGIKGSQDVDVIGRLISGADGLATSFADAESASGALATEVEKRYATAESQLKMFRNRVTDVARVVGAQLIPMMLSALKAAEAFGRWLIGVGVAASERLGGAWSDLRQAGENVVNLMSTLAEGGKLVGGALAQLAGAFAIQGITTFADIVERTTNVLSDHSYAVYLVAGAYGALKVAPKGAVAAGVVWDVITSGAHRAAASMAILRTEMQFFAITQGLTKPAAAMASLRSSIVRVATSSVSAGNIASGAFAGIAIGAGAATIAMNAWSREGEKAANAWLAALADTNDPTTFEGGLDYLLEANAEVQRLQAKLNELDGTGIGSLRELPEKRRLMGEIATATAEVDKFNPKILNMYTGITKLEKASGLTQAEIKNLADRAGVDLADAFDKGGKAGKELQAEYERSIAAAEEWGISTADAALMSADQLQLVEEQVGRITAAGEAAESAWSQWSSILNNTDDPVDPEAVKRSEEMVQDARDRVTEAQKEAAAGGQTAEEAERTASALGDARDALVEATESHADLLATDSPLNADKVKKFYEDRLAEAEAFATNMNTAIEAGYDPQLLAKLMAAGPEAAGPVLEALVEDTSGAYVESINNAEEALEGFTEFAVRQAQLTQRAIEIGTREAAEQLGTAMAIEQQSMLDPNLTGAEIASRLGISAEEAQSVIATFNLDVKVDANLDTAEQQINEFNAADRVTDIVALAMLDVADEDLSELERRERVTEIVADAITNDAELSLLGLSEERVSEITALAITSYATDALDTAAGQGWIATMVAQAITREAEDAIQILIRDRWITVTVDEVRGRSYNSDYTSVGGKDNSENRWGGLYAFASGGITQAHVGVGTRYKWAEPETGGEAFIPRLGNRWRSIGILGQAASWYGMALTPKQANQAPPPPPVPYGGALVRSITAAPAAGRDAPLIGEFHQHGIEPNQRKAMREAQIALGTYG